MMTARVISKAELRSESEESAATRTIRCSNCGVWIRYTNGLYGRPDDRVTVRPTGAPGPHDERFVICPGCGKNRVIALGWIL